MSLLSMLPSDLSPLDFDRHLAAKTIHAAAKAREAGALIAVDATVPYAHIHLPGRLGFVFLGEKADHLLAQYSPLAQDLGVPLEDVLLYAAQGW